MPIGSGIYVRALLLLTAALAALAVLAPAAWAAPANDAFSAAETLPASLPATGSGSNLEATEETGEPDHDGDPGGHSVWFEWTPSVDGPVGISPGSGCFSGIDPLIAVYTGSAIDTLTPVASNKGFPPPTCFGEGLQVEFDAVAGTTYRIATDGRNGSTGWFSFTINGAPENDDFAEPAPIGADPPQQAFASTRFATKQAGEPNHADDLGGHSVWFTWTPATDGPIAISTCSSFYSLDTLLAVYTGSDIASLTPVASNDDAPSTEGFPGCASANSEVRFNAAAATTYLIAVDSAGARGGRFSLRLRGRPDNDDFEDARALPNDPTFPIGASQATTDMATEEVGEPNHAGGPGGQSVWFSWTAAGNGRVSISTCTHESSADPDTLLAIYTGSAVNALTPIAADDDGAVGCRSSDSEVSFLTSAGTTYRIAVDSKTPSPGRFDLRLELPPPNDSFSASQTLSASLPSFATGTTKAATEESNEPDHAGQGGAHSAWFSWTPAKSGPVLITACPYTETVVPVLAVYTGSTLGSLAPVATDDAGGGYCRASASEVSVDVVAGTTYRIAVDGEDGNEGGFSLEIRGRPSNDDFETPEALGPTPMTAGGSNTLAGKQPGEPSHADDGGGHSLWFTWTPSSSGPVDITACGRSREIDTLLAVYTGGALGSLTPVASNDDADGPPANELCEFSRGNSEVVFDAVAGTTYRIAIDGKGGSTGYFGLAFEWEPANDDFSASQPLDANLPAYGSAVTKLATKEVGETNHAGDPGGHSVWYSWTPTSDGQVAISACAYYGDIEPVVAVYTGLALGGLAPVISADDDPAGTCRGTGSEAQFSAVAGTTYRIAVDGKANSSGGVQLILEGVAPNDDFGEALSLGGALPAHYAFYSNRFATKQLDEPDHAGNAGGSSLWFKWTAPVSAEVSVDTCGSGFDTLLAVYTGASIDALTPVAASDDAIGSCGSRSKLSFPAIANTTYRIAIDGKDGKQGALRLSIGRRPANDDFAAADKIPASIGWYWPGTTRLATKQFGEPDHGGEPGGHSVWFEWTPSKDEAIELDACTTGLDPVLAVYTGSTVSALSAVPTSDAGLGQCDQGRSIGFEAVAGTTYRIAVDGAGGDDGDFELHLRRAVEHPRSLRVSSAGAGSVLSSPEAIECASSCSYAFEVGETVTLSAEPAPGFSFAGWSGGGCSGTGLCQVTLNADSTVLATFTSASTGGGGEPVPQTLPPPGPKPKALHCKRGFKKKKVRGKVRCVKKKVKRHRKRNRAAP